MKSRHLIDPSLFVVRLCDGSAIADLMDTLRELGSVETMPAHPDRCVLRVASESDDPKATWQQLRGRVGAEFDVEPALVDDRGTPSYPTGTVTVRFEDSPTDDELTECERQWDMRVRERNEYVPSQVTFERTASTVCQYLPDVIESIQRTAKRVRAVWPDTISRYERL